MTTTIKRRKIISAGAGSGKTYRLTTEMVALLKSGMRASGIIATTFTAKAAAELQERVRTKLLEDGLTEQANDLSNALIGTVHGLGVKLLKRFAFEAGVSPEVAIIAEEDTQIMFNRSLSQILTPEKVEHLHTLQEKLGMDTKKEDWRKEVRYLVDIARTNAFDQATLERSKKQSFTQFQTFLDPIDPRLSTGYNETLAKLLDETIAALTHQTLEADKTKKTLDALGDLKTLRNELRQRGYLMWKNWVKLGKASSAVGAKSKDLVEDLAELANSHTRIPDFHADIEGYINALFDIVIEAIEEYTRYKKQRGLIDYTDMEVLVFQLLDHPTVIEVLKTELDLLMVDEFQDTSPIQLAIFLKLSDLALYSIWVGDPKQSIYGFRGAEPRLMKAVIEHVGIQDEDILKDSWRSRPDIVYATNAIFCKAFKDLPTEQVALNPKRTDGALQSQALIHWRFLMENDGTKRPQATHSWTNNAIATATATFLQRDYLILPKGESEYRKVRPGDIAILCRTNDNCLSIAEALHNAGLKAATARVGLLNTAEAKLILAVLRYCLNKQDSLAVAEILYLASDKSLTDIIDDRLNFLYNLGDNYDWRWAIEQPFIKKINELRPQTAELSANEILNLVLEELDLRRIIAAWGNINQRLENVDVLRKLSLQYEDACNRLHSAASLGGFLLWLARVGERSEDKQSSGESAEAVNVLTYHKSKGLEYPVVILADLEQNLRDSLFGISIQSDTEGVDLNAILAHRWLRFWPNPYDKLYKSTALYERLEASPDKIRVQREVLLEEARLLYVGVTRARDYLIFPSSPNPTRWLNRVWHDGKEDFPTLEEGNETLFTWENKILQQEYEETYFERTFGSVAIPPEIVHFIEPWTGKSNHAAYKITVSEERLPYEIVPKTSEPFAFTNAMAYKEAAVASVVSKIAKAYLTAYEWEEKPTEAAQQRNLDMAKALVLRFKAEDMVDSLALAKQFKAFYDFIGHQFDVKNVFRRYPVRHHFRQRLFEMDIDLLGQNSVGDLVVVFFDDISTADTKKMKAVALEYALTGYFLRRALLNIFDVKDIQFLIHFIHHGTVVALKF